MSDESALTVLASFSGSGPVLKWESFVCKVNCTSKGTCILQQRKSAENPCYTLSDATKKTALLKNSFVVLNSNNGNSIKCQKAPIGEPVLSTAKGSNGFHCWLFKDYEDLVIGRCIPISIVVQVF